MKTAAEILAQCCHHTEENRENNACISLPTRLLLRKSQSCLRVEEQECSEPNRWRCHAILAAALTIEAAAQIADGDGES